MKKLFLFRHGETNWNRDGKLQGHADIPLNELGKEQALKLVAPLSRMKLDAFLSSDLGRAQNTAMPTKLKLCIPLYTDARLREVDYGELQGATQAEINNRFGIQFTFKGSHTPLSDDVLIKYGAETASHAVTRVMEAIHDFVSSHPECERIGVSTHGGIIRRLLLHLNFSKDGVLAIPNGTIFQFQYDLSTRALHASHTIDYT